MSDAGDVPAADRAAAVLGRTAGISVPLDPDEYEGTRGPELGALVEELEFLQHELTYSQDCAATSALVEARLGRCLAVRFGLEGAPADRERAVRLLDGARTSALLGHEDREAARRDLVCLLGSRLVRLNRETSPGSRSQWTIDQLTSMLAVGTPLTQGGSGMVEDTGLLVRLLLEREQEGMTPADRDNLRGLGALTDALLKGDTDAVVGGARHLLATMPGMALPPPLAALMPSMLSMLEDALGEVPDAVPTGAVPADDPDDARDVQHVRTQLLALTEVMSPGTIAPHELPRLLAELSGERDSATGEEGGAPLPSRMIAALFHGALAARTGDLEGFREAFRLMHEAHAKGELDSRVHAEWLRTVVPGLLLAAALTGGSLQDEDMARALLEAQQWDDDPASGIAASLRLCGETVRLNEKLMSALDSGDDAAVEDVIDALCELELDETYDDAEEWTGALLGFVLGSAYLGRVVLAPSAHDRTDHLRAAAHHLRRAVETSVDMPALRGVLDSTWAPLITLTAIAESDPSRIAEGVRRTRKALESPGFTPDWRPRSRSGIAIALDTLHILTGDPEPLDEAIAELEQALTELPDGTPSGARLTWDQAVLRAKRATLRAGTPDADDELRAAVGLARTSLRLAADDVLLQQGVRRGLRIARAAADRGRSAAFWALRAGLTEEAIACLEAGRSLVLGAAAVSAGIADRLAALGETGLAERWRSAAADRSWDRTEDRSLLELAAAAGTGTGLPGDLRDRSPLEVLAEAGAGAPDLPGDLRRRSLDVLRGQDDADVQPVLASVGDLRAGLGETGADALLYLVPGVDGPDGAVLLVTRDGPVEALPLPGLAPAGRGPVAEYLEAGAHRQRLEAAALDSHDTVNPRDIRRAERRWLGALDRMCEWAGGVLGPALDHLGVWDRALGEAGFLGTSDAAGHRAVRLVLVPCGELGVVPWQAAVLRPPASHGVPRAVRACEVAVLTHAASGREFLRAAARRRMQPADRPALVFHGTDDLEWAEDEIETLAEVHYPRAVIHRPDDDPATPETVLALLGGRAALPASLVHIACHGLAGPDPTRSALQLAAPAEAASGGALTLSTLLETPAEGDAFRSAGPLVVCGGCETDLTTRDHDEALTVTSVMVHRLAADAVGSRWKVDDMRSEVLMLVLHDALARGLAPPDALRAAQRWMLTPPDERPAVRGLGGVSARRLAEDLRDRPDTWAAFVHHGNPAPAARSARPEEGERV
ncbi:CHAT domain-containing protein [Streptomyces sp. BK340]|uniref:CHAT domain-containing protein n=1 Tax=Streptomyces sp. BK340 TaxID=2572903 RepID=UPI0011A9C0A4|nr:CHAT domain-containing protein [Streptomyces sp. BK340]TVZ92496.1 CHAT domain-containing protein [Streptomyces sp. BK340]